MGNFVVAGSDFTLFEIDCFSKLCNQALVFGYFSLETLDF